jgi:tetratricopeptide (TPR) repeat protein
MNAREHFARAEKLWETGRHSDCLAQLERGLAIAPEDPDLLIGRGTASMYTGNNDAAIRDLTAAYQIDGDPQTRWTLAIALLRAGRWAEGWRAYKSFLVTRPEYGVQWDTARPCWDGQDLDGHLKNAIRFDEGIGDNIFNLRFIPKLFERGASRVVLEAQPKLHALLRATFDRAGAPVEIVKPGAPLSADCECPWMMLPGILDARPGDPACPYLTVPEDRVEHWRQRLRRAASAAESAANAAPLVGLTWVGGVTGDQKVRSLPQSVARRLVLGTRGVRWVSFERTAQAHLVAAWNMTDVGCELQDDMLELAAAMSACDLMVMCDNTAAHVAGALGVRTWLFTSLAGHWRWWCDGCENSPWSQIDLLKCRRAVYRWAAARALQGATPQSQRCDFGVYDIRLH